MTIVEMLERNAKERPDKLAIVFRNNRISYGQLNNLVNRHANSFVQMGLRKGDRVGLMLTRTPFLVVGFLATAKVGAVAVPINFELTSEDIRILLKTTSPLLLVVNSAFVDLARRSMPHARDIPIVAFGDIVGDSLLWNAMLMRDSSGNPSLDIKDDDIVYLNYTSGSTGNPKGAVTTHSNVYWNTIAAMHRMQMGHDDVHLCLFAPFAHPHEIFARPLYLGGTIVLVDNIYPKSIAEAIAKHKVSCMMGLAPMYQKLLELLERYHYDLSSLRLPESGGMCTHPALVDQFKRKVGVPIVPVWGSTETTGIALANRAAEYPRPCSVGKPCASYSVKIVGERGKELPPGEIGEMIFNGPAVVQGYYESTTGNQLSFRAGWYYSGDLGRKDEEGNFYFMGRKTGMMKVAGLKVYPLEIEMALAEHPDIGEVAVIPAKDDLRGEVPRAVIVARNGKCLTKKEVLAFCQGRLAHYKLPRIIEIRESLPRIGSFKIDRKMLESMYESIAG